MHDVQELARASTRRLPEGALAGLRGAFAQEVSERLPRLQAAVDSGTDTALDQALRDAHTLGSSAAVLGEGEASRTARAAEALLLARPPGGPVPAGLQVHVAELQTRLGGWRR